MSDSEQVNEFARTLQERRQQLGLSLSEVARRAGMDKGSLSLLERGLTKPKPESIRALAHVLGIPASDLLTAADYLPSGDLPSLRPYMRARYRQLPDEALTEIEEFVEHLARQHGMSQPQDHEDEQ
jgi:transcriptional regulator with XRE-family HTH domain